MAGTVERGYARAAGILNERVTVLPDNPSAVAAVRAGRIDAFAGTALTAGLAHKNEGWRTGVGYTLLKIR